MKNKFKILLSVNFGGGNDPDCMDENFGGDAGGGKKWIGGDGSGARKAFFKIPQGGDMGGGYKIMKIGNRSF
jgi:hypothetical protein